jgi:hypothetical protein
MFAAVFYATTATAMQVASPLLWAALLAALVAVLTSQVGGDRLDLHVWVLLAFALVVNGFVRSAGPSI